MQIGIAAILGSLSILAIVIVIVVKWKRRVVQRDPYMYVILIFLISVYFKFMCMMLYCILVREPFRKSTRKQIIKF